MSVFGFGQNHVLSLDGQSGYVELPQSIIQTDHFTIEAWVLMSGPGGGLENQSLIYSQRSNSTACDLTAINFSSETWATARTERLAIRTDDENCIDFVEAPAPEYGTWNHYAAVLDGQLMRLYLNGVLRAEAVSGHTGQLPPNADHIELGRHQHSYETHGLLAGCMDEVRIWDYDLDQSEILGNMYRNFQGDEAGLLAYWDFEDEQGVVVDRSGNGNDGIRHPGAEIIFGELPHNTPLWGDLNNDSQVNISDVILLINHILGIEQ